jgi:hypothetical protein
MSRNKLDAIVIGVKYVVSSESWHERLRTAFLPKCLMVRQAEGVWEF